MHDTIIPYCTGTDTIMLYLLDKSDLLSMINLLQMATLFNKTSEFFISKWGIKMIIMLLVIGLFIGLGIVFTNGKGSFLIAGYNTMPAEEKEKFNIPKEYE